MRWIIGALIASFAGAVFAQDLTDSELAQKILEDLQESNETAEATNTLGQVVPTKFAQLRFLDRLNGQVQLFELEKGESTQIKHLKVGLESCFVPSGNASADAVAFLDIDDQRDDLPDFTGWMIASSPALSAYDHPRYDVWVVSCTGESKVSDMGDPTAPPARPEFTDAQIEALALPSPAGDSIQSEFEEEVDPEAENVD